ncbi:MAG TPA: hypothetical protein DC057_01665 [Spirochaetia bacterium]|nr:hypothetical protein [Spirochaetia bacterium]
MEIKHIMQQLSESVKYRIENYFNDHLFNEDCLRYDLFYFFAQNGIDHKNIILEYSHPNEKLSAKAIDMVIKEKSLISFELKYFREIPSKQNIDRTGQMASFIRDIIKLKLIRDTNFTNKFVVLLTTEEMKKYIMNNGFEKLIDSSIDEEFVINIERKSPHFTKQIFSKLNLLDYKEFNNLKLKKIYGSEINHHYLLCYSV